MASKREKSKTEGQVEEGAGKEENRKRIRKSRSISGFVLPTCPRTLPAGCQYMPLQTAPQATKGSRWLLRGFLPCTERPVAYKKGVSYTLEPQMVNCYLYPINWIRPLRSKQ